MLKNLQLASILTESSTTTTTVQSNTCYTMKVIIKLFLFSSIYKYKMIVPEHQILDGRKYHTNDKIAYLFPEDDDGNYTIIYQF